MVGVLIAYYCTRFWAIKTSPGKSLLDQLAKDTYSFFQENGGMEVSENYVFFHVHNNFLLDSIYDYYSKDFFKKRDEIQRNTGYLNKKYKDFFYCVDNLYKGINQFYMSYKAQSKLADHYREELINYFSGPSKWDIKVPYILYFLDKMTGENEIFKNFRENFLDYYLKLGKYKDVNTVSFQYDPHEMKQILNLFILNKDFFKKTIKELELGVSTITSEKSCRKYYRSGEIIKLLEDYEDCKNKLTNIELDNKKEIKYLIGKIRNHKLYQSINSKK